MMGVFRRLQQWDSHMKLSWKLLISYICVVLIPAICIGYFSYKKSSAMIEQETSKAYAEALRQTALNITFRLKEIENISELMYTNEELQKILRRAKNGELNKSQELDDFKSITTLINNLQRSRNIYRIRLFVPGSPLYAGENNNIFSLSALSDDSIISELKQQRGHMKWKNTYSQPYIYNDTRKVVTLFRTIMDFDNLMESVGVVAIDMDERIFNEVFLDMGYSQQNHLFVFDENELVTAYTSPSAPSGIPEFHTIVKPLQNLALSGEWGIIKARGKEYLTVVHHMEYVHWTFASLIPVDVIRGAGKSIRYFTMLLVTGFTVLAVILAILLSNRITRRIRVLADSMRSIEQGNYNITIEESGHDEISLLQRRFNRMTMKIRNLIEEVYQIAISKQEAEIKVLGSQINSHFLYNTLDTIKWMAFKIKAQDIVYVIDTLSKFFRFSLNRGKDIITVENEMNHIRTYIDIQNVRFKNKIEFVLQIEPELYSCRMIKLVLQPLIENAIVHGIQKRQDKQGMIIVKGTRSGSDLLFQVIDDGVGMTAKKVAEVLLHEGQSYGLKNVNQRIKLYYGPTYGLTFYSRPGIGTSVEILLADHVHERLAEE